MHPFKTSLICVGLTIFSSAIALADPRADIDAAYARLASSPYRKKEKISALPGLPSGMADVAGPMITEFVGDRRRLVVETTIPTLGKVRTEQVTVAGRTAVRTVAPALVAMIERTKAKVTVSSVRNLVNQIVSVAAAAQTGGLGVAQVIQELATAAVSMRSVAEARKVLDQASAAYGTWQLVERDDVDDEFPTFPAVVTFLGRVDGGRAGLMKYQRKAEGGELVGMSAHEILLIDAETGFPAREETYVNGACMMRVEYLDIGAPITIEVPGCLQGASR